MNIERFVVAFSIAIVMFAIGYAGSAAVGTQRRAATPEITRPLDPRSLAKKLETLDARLREAQTRIDEVLLTLANTADDSQRDATRVRLDVLYRLESGLVADIARARDELQSLAAGRVDSAWRLHDSKNR